MLSIFAAKVVVERWECEWHDMKKTNRELQRFIATEVRRLLDQVKIMSPERLLNVCPIFKNTEISRDDVGEFMKAYAEEHNIMAQPRRSLIGSMKGEKILLAIPLLKWYLEHSLEVTKVHQVIEFTPEPCFKPFGDAVSDARRAGDADPNKAIIAGTMKLVSCGFAVGNKGWKRKHCHSANLLKCFFLIQVWEQRIR